MRSRLSIMKAWSRNLAGFPTTSIKMRGGSSLSQRDKIFRETCVTRKSYGVRPRRCLASSAAVRAEKFELKDCRHQKGERLPRRRQRLGGRIKNELAQSHRAL